MADNLDAIELLVELQKSDREPSEEEKGRLARYIDFGGLRQLWDQQQKFTSEHARLAELLLPEQIENIKQTSINTHYTSLPVVDGVWNAVRRLGFKGGSILEPGMGIGNFVGRIPKDLAAKSRVTGIEKNLISGAMAQFLYPDATVVIRPFQDVRIPNDSFDLIVGNPPFGEIKIYDPDYSEPKLSIHNYFICKSLDKLKEGGIAALITSHYTLDSQSADARREFYKRADLIAAIRLPNTAFKKNAGTEVTTDILFFRKIEPRGSEERSHTSWLSSVPIQTNGAPVFVNEYFLSHPEMLLGRHSTQGGMYGANEYCLEPLNEDPQLSLKTAIELLPENIAYQELSETRSPQAQQVTDEEVHLVGPEIKENAFYLDQGRVWLRSNGARSPIPQKLDKPSVIEQLKKLIELRDQLKKTIHIQMDSDDDSALKTAQTELLARYEAYRRKYGALNAPKTARVFEEDPEYPLLTALENVDPETKAVTRAEIFAKRTARPYRPLSELPADPQAAMLKVLADRGTLDLPLMARLLRKKEGEIVENLEAAGLIFKEPTTGEQLPADKYLSGNVRLKLRQAQNAAQLEPQYNRNVDALRAVQPERISVLDIDARLGQTWIPTQFYVKFIHEGLNESQDRDNAPKVSRDHQGRWYVELAPGYARFNLTHKWAGGGIPAHKLVEDGLNQRQPTVYFPEDSEGHRDMDPVNTAAARAKLQEIKDEFGKWVKSDATRQFHAELEEKYNDAFNGIRLREYDGKHLTFPGLNPDYTPRHYQANAIWRIVQEGRALIAHDVGLGKTLTAIAAGMEARRMGLSKKNLYVVPNNMIPQWREDFKATYPAANVLAVSDADLSNPLRRKRLFSRIATNEWDAVIVPHSQFNMLPISPERESITIRRQLGAIESTLKEYDIDGTERKTRDRSAERSLRQLEVARQQFEERLKELTQSARKDNTVYFDELGIDMLFIDEAHAYKALPFATKMGNIAGLSTRRSQRAENLLAKIEYMLDTHKQRGIVFLTGTPITNTLGEVYVMTRYVAPDLLDAAGINHFDDWAANFAEAVTRMEYATDGATIRPKTALANYVNVPELQQIWAQFADVMTKADAVAAGELKEPRVSRKDILVKVTPEQEPMLQEIVDRAELLMLPRGDSRHPDPKVDNWLKLDGDARDISLDARMRDSLAVDHPDNKATAAVKITVDVLERTKQTRGTVVLFSDRYQTSDGRFHLFNDIKDKLIKMGIPSQEIAIVHEYAKREQFLALQGAFRSGRVRVLMGTTEKLGIGVNIQTRLKALVHLDLPQRPDQVEQREGRISRFGNMNDDVEIYRLISEPRNVHSPKAHDLQRAQLLERKQTFLSQFRAGTFKGRRIEDLAGEVRLNPQIFALAKAQATGNPLALEKIKLEYEIKQISLLDRSYQHARYRNREELDRTEFTLTILNKALIEFRNTLAHFSEHEKRDDDGTLLTMDIRFDTHRFSRLKEVYEYLKRNPELTPRTEVVVNGINIPLQTNEKVTSMGSGDLLSYAAVRYYFAGEWHDVPQDLSKRDGSNATAAALLASILARARGLPDKIQGTAERIAVAQETIIRLGKELGQTSPYAAKLNEYQKRLSEVENELMKGIAEASEIVDVNEEQEQEIHKYSPEREETSQRTDAVESKAQEAHIVTVPPPKQIRENSTSPDAVLQAKAVSIKSRGDHGRGGR